MTLWSKFNRRAVASLTGVATLDKFARWHATARAASASLDDDQDAKSISHGETTLSHASKLLAQNSMFSALHQDQRDTLGAKMLPRSFQAGQLIFAHGDMGNEVYLVTQGRVRLSIDSADGRSLAFTHASKGDIFGEIATLDGGQRTADAIALTKVEVLTLHRTVLRDLVNTSSEFAEAVILLLCKKLRDTSEQVEQVVLNQIEIRVARFLLHTLKFSAPSGLQKVRLELGMSQGELALLIGSTRQTVNSALSSLERYGAIQRVGSALECDYDGLVRIIGEGRTKPL